MGLNCFPIPFYITSPLNMLFFLPRMLSIPFGLVLVYPVKYNTAHAFIVFSVNLPLTLLCSSSHSAVLITFSSLLPGCKFAIALFTLGFNCFFTFLPSLLYCELLKGKIHVLPIWHTPELFQCIIKAYSKHLLNKIELI